MKLKKFLTITLLIFSFTSFLHSQNHTWITPNKTYLKLYIADDGIYRLNKSDFTNAGINTSSVNPKTVKVYNKGKQVPVYFKGESDGVFNDSDFVDFYGTRNYGGPWTAYNIDNQFAYSSNEWFNLYSDTNVYWIDWGGANGIRMQNSSYIAPVNYSQSYSNQLLHLEKDKIYWIGQATSGNDFGNFSNERYLGETWYWNLLYNGQSLSDTFSIPQLYRNSGLVSMRLFAYPQSASFTVTNEHNIEIKVNGNVVKNFVRNDFNRVDSAFTFPSSLLSDSTVNTVTATYTSSGGFSGTMFIDLFEFNYPQKFKFRNNYSKHILTGGDSTSKKIKVSGYNPGNQTFIYDVSNNVRIDTFSASSDTLIFSAKQNAVIEITNKNITKKPIRIIQRNVPDLLSLANGIEYLIIYPKIFESQAIQLKNHRELTDGFRSIYIDIQDIYDVFNFGLIDPSAIKNFISNIYNPKASPNIRYLCLLGRGSLDPKKNSDATIYSENHIPVKGVPSSDNYYSNVNQNSFTFYNQISIGRLPALTVSEAQNMVDNIISYETQPPQSWWKDFTFIAGGVNQSEQDLFNSLYYDSLINPQILPNPLKGNPVAIMRNDLNGAQTFNIADSVKNQIDRGTMMINFIGHAGSQDWEIAMHDPDVLNNTGKLPVIFSMTCYTGKVGEPKFRSFGENYMRMNNRGAAAFFATSGWGFIYSGSLLNTSIYRAFAKDTIRRIGDLISYGTNVLKPDSSSFSIRHTVNCYTLMGDPALKLRYPKYPEFSITENDYELSNDNPSVNEPVNLKIYPKNYGLNSDSTTIGVVISKSLKQVYSKNIAVHNFSSADTLFFDFKLSNKGKYDVKVILDVYNSSPNEDKSNNILTFSINANNTSFVPFIPVHNSVVKNENFEYIGLNPFVRKNEKTIKLLLETDTSKNFNSPLKQMFVNNSPQGVVTKFNATIPVNDTSAVFYWRTNSIVNGDSAGWSAVQMFKYNPSFISSERSGDNIIDSNTTIYKISQSQFHPYELNNVSYNTENSKSGLRINKFNGELFVRSLGSNGSEASYFSVLNKSIHIDAGANTGLNLIKVRKLDGKILQYKNFKMIFSNSSDSVLNFLNTFDTTHYLMGLNAAYVAGTFLLNANTVTKFNQFGSTKITNFRIGFFDSWTFIGYLGAQPSDVSEDVHPYASSWIESKSFQTKSFSLPAGTSTFNIGPANSWKNFSWNNILASSNQILFDVYGVKNDGSSDLLFQNISANSYSDLSSINAIQYPNLNLEGKYSIDTITGKSSPVLTSFKINYNKPAEIIAELDDFWKSDSISVSGNFMKVRFKIYNAGELSLPGYIANVYYQNNLSNVFLRSDTMNIPLQVNSNITHESKFKIPVQRNRTNVKETYFVEILPKGNFNEAFTFNNYVYFDLQPSVQTQSAGIDIFSDGKKIQSGDNVSQNPEFKIIVNNELDLDNSGSIINLNDVIINGVSVNNNLAAEKNNNRKLKGDLPLKKNSVFSNEIYFNPDLKKGENILRILTGNTDGNIDTADYVFNVSDEFSINELTNYPNPMKNETNFMFDLAGFEDPGKGIIKIYTISGRLIRQIEIPANIGFNTVSWDGKDSDGDLIANGTYLYKLSVGGTYQLESEVMKLVVLK